jgi:hypothetical protein
MDSLEGLIMSGLQTQFEPYKDIPLVGGEKLQDGLAHSVRPRGHRQPDHVTVFYRFVIELAETGDRCIGVGEGLKIGNKFLGAVPLSHEPPAAVHLIRDGKIFYGGGPGSRATRVAVDASFSRQGPIPIGAAEPCVQRYLLDTLAEDFPKIGVVVTVSVHRTSSLHVLTMVGPLGLLRENPLKIPPKFFRRPHSSALLRAGSENMMPRLVPSASSGQA